MNHPTYLVDAAGVPPAFHRGRVRPIDDGHMWFRMQWIYGVTVTDPRQILSITAVS